MERTHEAEPAPKTDLAPRDAWQKLRAFTPARIALGRAGAGAPTREVLAFGLAHAKARDAVHAVLDLPALRLELESDGWTVNEVRSRAPDRVAYLARPDWGRRLADADTFAGSQSASPPDVVFVVSDGLSAVAVQAHAAALLRAVRPLLHGLVIADIVIATQARVALADEVGERVVARIAVSVIGERPGLSVPDSLGLYVTYDPRPGRSDAERNCISNIHGAGMAYADAAAELARLIRGALQARLTGVALNRALPAP